MIAQCEGVVDEIKKSAQERGKKKGLSYAGELLPAEAHKMMQAGAKLVDVRTKPELQYVGKVPGSLAIEWQTYPGNRENPEFLAELAAAVPKDTPVMFLCRSGARSHAAADAAKYRRDRSAGNQHRADRQHVVEGEDRGWRLLQGKQRLGGLHPAAV